MIDTHCHLTDERLLPDAEGVLRRARAAGVQSVVTVGTDLEDDRATVDLAQRLGVRCTVGIHPNYTAGAVVADVAKLREIAARPPVAALGEMGLDYFHDRASAEHQAEMFGAQLQLAVEMGLPAVIHCRGGPEGDAVGDCLAILRGFASVPAVFHCFSGTAQEARRVLDAGYLLSFTGAVTFKKNQALREVTRLPPADRLLLETDAPYLSPEPHRGRMPNEPALVVHTAAVIARQRDVSVEELDQQTTENAERFFRIAGVP